jgi:hypothetical protein
MPRLRTDDSPVQRKSLIIASCRSAIVFTRRIAACREAIFDAGTWQFRANIAATLGAIARDRRQTLASSRSRTFRPEPKSTQWGPGTHQVVDVRSAEPG